MFVTVSGVEWVGKFGEKRDAVDALAVVVCERTRRRPEPTTWHVALNGVNSMGLFKKLPQRFQPICPISGSGLIPRTLDFIVNNA
jgi:hypothetical protein